MGSIKTGSHDLEALEADFRGESVLKKNELQSIKEEFQSVKKEFQLVRKEF